MTKHLTGLLAAVLFCGFLVSVSQRSPVTVSGLDAATAKAAPKPAAKPTTKPKPKRKSNLPTPAEEKELLSFLRKSRRDFYNGLMTQKKSSDRRYQSTLQFAWQWYKRYKSLDLAVKSEIDREQKARLEISKVLGRIKKIKDDKDGKERKKLLSDLTKQATIQFDAQMKVTKYKLDQAAHQLSRLRKEQQNRQAERSKIVAQRVEEYLKAANKSSRKK